MVSRLPDLRPDAQSPENNDPGNVIVIGAGAIGVCTAYYLQSLGYSVTVLEKGDVCSGCSGGNAGLLVPSHVVPLAAPGVIKQGLKWMFNPESPFYIRPRFNLELLSWIWRFRAACNEKQMRRSMTLLHQLCQQSMILFDELITNATLTEPMKKNGLLMLYKTEKGRKSCLQAADLARECCVAVESLDEIGVRKLDPGIAGPVLGGTYYPGDAHLDPRLFVTQLAAGLENAGVRFFPDTEVLGFQTGRGRITSVRTNRGSFSARTVVLTGGAWSPGMVRGLKLKLPVQPAKGYSLTLPIPNGGPSVPLILSEEKVTVTPLDGALRFAGTLELAGLDASVNRRRVMSILRTVPHYLPDFQPETFEPSRIWSGFRPCTPDGLPVIGRAPGWENLILATGHAMIGMTLAPITGSLAAALVSGSKPAIDLAELGVDRFG